MKTRFENFRYFHSYLGKRIFISLGLNIFTGLFDGIGLAMFLPLLTMVTQTNQATPSMGGLDFLLRLFQNLGITLSLFSVLVVIVFCFSLKGVSIFISEYYNTVVRLFFIKKLRFKSINKLSQLSYHAFLQLDSGRIQNTLSGESSRVSQAYVSYFSMLQSVVLVVFYSGVAIITNPSFALLVILGGALSNYIFKKIYNLTKDQSTKVTQGSHIFQGLIIQLTTNFKYLKSSNTLEVFRNRTLQMITYIEGANKRIGFFSSVLNSTREPLAIMIISFVIVIQVQVLRSDLSGVILALLFFYRSLTHVTTAQKYWNKFLTVSASLDNMTKFHNELDKSTETIGEVLPKEMELQTICFDSVDFSYGSRQILRDINFEVRRNKSIAFVGPSGSGKSTVLALLTGLIEAQNGRITINDIDTKVVLKSYLRSKIGYITQDPVMFEGSVYENVTLWSEESKSNIDRFNEACRVAELTSFIDDLPEGRSTLVGIGGNELSGGQRQRINIARELFKNTEVLIFDEATSALDSETEKKIKDNIQDLHGLKTLIYVAHRLSTIKAVDEIVVLINGNIESKGTYDELFRTSEAFRDMALLQMT